MMSVKTLMMSLLAVVATTASFFSNTATAESDQSSLPGLLEFTEWQVPWENSRPRDPYVAPDGTIWFVGQVGHYVAKLDPKTGDMQKFDIPVPLADFNRSVGDLAGRNRDVLRGRGGA